MKEQTIVKRCFEAGDVILVKKRLTNEVARRFKNPEKPVAVIIEAKITKTGVISYAAVTDKFMRVVVNEDDANNSEYLRSVDLDMIFGM